MEMTAADKKVIGSDLQTVEYGWPVGMPVCRPMGNGLFEVRSDIKDGIARVLFCIHEGKMVLLHGFVKKSQKTPAGDSNSRSNANGRLSNEQGKHRFDP